MPFIKNIAPILLFLVANSFNQSCSTSTFGQRADSLFLVDDMVKISYDLKRPDEKYFLPYVLEEVSGLTFKHPNHLIAIDDESGKIFTYDLNQKEIVHSIVFQKAGDYEGVELLGDSVYVLKSDGDIFRFLYSTDKESIATKYENKLSSDNDTEGLGLDAERNLLLIACKEEGGIDEKIRGRAFYSFSLLTNELNPTPEFVIGPLELKRFWENHRSFEYNPDRIKFKPSGIATHPITGDYYILSSVGKMLVVTDKDGMLLATYPIAPRVLGQPEGICFSPAGDLFISSEGEGDRGYILKFKMQRKD